MRERLIEILSQPIFPKVGVDPAEALADYLIDNGVIVPPCKVGDTVRFKGLESHWKVSAIHIYKEGAPQISITTESGKITSTMTFAEFAEFAFVISREEAEKALKKRSGG